MRGATPEYERGLHINKAAEGTRIRGIGFAHYAGEGLKLEGPNVTLENNTFSWNAISGVRIRGGYGGTNATVKGNSFVRNGMLGLRGGQTTGSVFDGNQFTGNNSFERFAATWSASGIKLTDSENVEIYDNVLEGNWGHAIWMDGGVVHPTIVRNTVRGVGSNAGIHLEISPGGPRGAIIASNVISGAGAGIQISNSNDARIWNNTLVGNDTNLIVNKGDRRGGGEEGTRVLPVTNTIAKNNLFSDPTGGTTLKASKFDACTDQTPLFDTLNFNVYHRSNAGDPATLIHWAPVAGTAGCTRSFARLTQAGGFQDVIGREPNGLALDNVARGALFVNASAGNYRLVSGSPAARGGDALPADIAAAVRLGLSSADAASIDVGANTSRGALHLHLR
ncbi:right-handed parallel beta-helix repeat-containing protein [Deinococcus planocerae]|uniref:right-handed parallel beta-helix repeat-containing protein n=1 Tax=Deinococcus planocerae TaxID=1737569 RepID=UPI000C7F6003|nr:right-handed parallel beta-helix repeat-containing protein [Deinococcus planocerae]